VWSRPASGRGSTRVWGCRIRRALNTACKSNPAPRPANGQSAANTGLTATASAEDGPTRYHGRGWRARKDGRERFHRSNAPTHPGLTKIALGSGSRYGGVITDVFLDDLIPDRKSKHAPHIKRNPAARSAKLKDYDELARQWTSDIEWAVDYIDALSSLGCDEDAEVQQFMDQASLWWTFLKSSAGLNIRGILRRRALVPFVMVPHHVSARYGTCTQPSLLDLLREAQNAFIFGVPLSSIALMRATLERTLVEHYEGSGEDLQDKIDSVPDGWISWRSRQNLHAIRRLANRALHPRRDGQTGDTTPTEEEMATHLEALRALIENAPVQKSGSQSQKP
jgi:hypothetical protein